MTFVDEAINYPGDNTTRNRRAFTKHKNELLCLIERERGKSTQLICLLYGPGGSGKTTVIDLLLEYAKEYCTFIEGMEFNSHTIVVTALTGVAATILRGQTTQKAVHLCKKKT
jgi:replication-associated recombination protein RarA